MIQSRGPSVKLRLNFLGPQVAASDGAGPSTAETRGVAHEKKTGPPLSTA